MHRKQRMKRMTERELEHRSFYRRIIERGYGPPEGMKLDRAGWRWYFDEMHKMKRLHLISYVFGDVLPKEWRAKPLEIRVEWLDGVDKGVTSRSHTFASCPRYQYIWQNGFGPGDGENLDIEAWRKYMDEMPKEKRKNMDDDLFTIPHVPVHVAKLRRMYTKQIQESEGFDVDVRIDGDGTIAPMFDDMSQAKYDDSLIQYSRKALHAYNDKEGTDYTVTEVVKACNQAVVGVMYYITFQGKNYEGHIQDFQAKVHQHPKASEEIVLVRPKPIGSSFCRRIMRLGYGPPDGYKLDKRGWRSYFYRTNEVKIYNMILNVFADDLPKEWSPHEIRPQWLDGLDKDVTSRSPIFGVCPYYQYMWQNGYGPENGDEVDADDWEKFQDEMSEEDWKEMNYDLFDIPEDPVHRAKSWGMYYKQVHESQGFDVDVQIRGGGGTISPMFHDMSEAKYDDRLIQYSMKALDAYNDQEHTDCTLKEVVKACHQIVDGFMYYITFQASNSEGCTQDFQARVHHTLESEEKIVLVRTKPGNA